jgi:hypothetical protein
MKLKILLKNLTRHKKYQEGGSETQRAGRNRERTKSKTKTPEPTPQQKQTSGQYKTQENKTTTYIFHREFIHHSMYQSITQ